MNPKTMSSSFTCDHSINALCPRNVSENKFTATFVPESQKLLHCIKKQRNATLLKANVSPENQIKALWKHLQYLGKLTMVSPFKFFC
eukprot:Gb_38360 [translate_table: standard]